MNKQKQNLAIAKACGWEYVLRDERKGMPKYPHWVAPVGWYYSDSKFARAYREDTEGGILAPPNYLDSLDAMHEAEKTLKVGIEYYERLRDVCGRDSVGSAFTATAPQRAEAFLKTLNLWDNNVQDQTRRENTKNL